MQVEDAFEQKFKTRASHACDDRMSAMERGLVLGGSLLAKMGNGGLCIHGEEERILTLLSVAHGRAVSPAVLGQLRRVSKHWRNGDKSLAAIHLAQSGLNKLHAVGAYRLSLSAKLLDAGVTPRELARELGLNTVHFDVSKYDENEPRVPAGNGRESGEWTSDDEGAGGGSGSASLVEGRSAAASTPGINREYGLPKDAIVVMRPDGTTIDDPDSPTGKLMASPKANFHEVYAEGTQSSNPLQIDEAIGHYGKFDFQRDSQIRIIPPINTQAITPLAYSWQEQVTRANKLLIFQKYLHGSIQVIMRKTNLNDHIGHQAAGKMRILVLGNE